MSLIKSITDHVAGALPHSMAVSPVSQQECQATFNNNPNTAVCGRAQGNACDVDNGSALVCTRGNGKFVLKGIYSTETGCGPNQLMKFTKMDLPFLNGGQGSAEKSLPNQPSHSFNPYQSTAGAGPTALPPRNQFAQNIRAQPTPQQPTASSPFFNSPTQSAYSFPTAQPQTATSPFVSNYPQPTYSFPTEQPQTASSPFAYNNQPSVQPTYSFPQASTSPFTNFGQRSEFPQPTYSFPTASPQTATSPFAHFGQLRSLAQTTYAYPTPQPQSDDLPAEIEHERASYSYPAPEEQPQADTVHNVVVPATDESPKHTYLPPN